MIKAYASYFISYLLANLKEIDKIDKIILFGSVAKNEAAKESDVDIFIELAKKSKLIEEKIKKILDSFYKSREALLFKTRGIDNKINIITGKLEEWPDLKNSIEATGIVLYGKYTGYSNIKSSSRKKYAIISWDNIKINRGAFLNKLYGVKINNKRYIGLIEQFKGKKLGKSTIMIPIEYLKEIDILIKKYKVNARIIEVYQ